MSDKYFRFAPGDEVVAIQDHRDGEFKKGDEFIIRQIKKLCCHIEVDIGIFDIDMNGSTCDGCGALLETGQILFIEQYHFAPKLSSLQSDELIEEMNLTETN